SYIWFSLVSLLISAPLEQYSQNRKGKIYRCTTSGETCQNIQFQGRSFKVKTMMLILFFQNTKKFSLFHKKGTESSSETLKEHSLPICLTECLIGTDIAFLLDGSGSVNHQDFQKIKTFVKNLFSVSQFSYSPKVHYYFNNFFSSGSWKSNIDRITQLRGGTYTAKAIEHAVGSRSNAKKVLIVITDGESQDSNHLPYAAQLAESKKIVRFAIGVGDAFNKPEAKQELDTIASFPSDKHVFQVRDFNALEIIRQNLEKTISIEGTNINLLCYSMAIAKTQRGSLTVIGAPRFKHRGTVLPFPWQYQTGEYFGAEVCTMDINNDDITDLIFISAPMYMEPDREGRVYVCRLTVLRGHAAVKGRFGSSLAVLPDLNSDGFRDLAVGAPLENNGEGSIYIFHSEGGRISPTYSQRITGSEVESGLKFFGVSISQSSFDQSGDGLPDLAVGSKGKVVLLRSRPIVIVKTDVSFSPKQILTTNVDCSKPLENTAELCFTMSRVSTVNTGSSFSSPFLNYKVTTHQLNVFYLYKFIALKSICDLFHCFVSCNNNTKPPLNGSTQKLVIGFGYTMFKLQSVNKTSCKYFFPSCALPQLGFEINCGNDNKCVDNLKVDFNFTRCVGIDELLNVTVTVENRGENSYNSRVILTHPAGLSYRKKFTIQQGRMECSPLDSEDGLSRGRTDCTINKPIFKNKTKVCFFISLVQNIFYHFWSIIFFIFLNHPQDCSVAMCRVFKCSTFMGRLQNSTKVIVGGSLGGLAFLALLTAGLYKVNLLMNSTVLKLFL
uniref:VWFA domain-containing protein n=1 Tax=Haplochromis burtoni TaxID=8153 RepID=A0A3Q2X691_HAPBU